MKTSYSIRLISPWRLVLTNMFGCVIMIFLMFVCDIDFPEWLVISVFTILLLVYFYLMAHYAATAEVEFKMDEKEFRFCFTKPFLLQRNGLGDRFAWEEIKRFKFKKDRNYYMFYLYMKDGSKIRFYKYRSLRESNDDFYAFYTDFNDCYSKYIS